MLMFPREFSGRIEIALAYCETVTRLRYLCPVPFPDCGIAIIALQFRLLNCLLTSATLPVCRVRRVIFVTGFCGGAALICLDGAAGTGNDAG